MFQNLILSIKFWTLQHFLILGLVVSKLIFLFTWLRSLLLNEYIYIHTHTYTHTSLAIFIFYFHKFTLKKKIILFKDIFNLIRYKLVCVVCICEGVHWTLQQCVKDGDLCQVASSITVLPKFWGSISHWTWSSSFCSTGRPGCSLFIPYHSSSGVLAVCCYAWLFHLSTGDPILGP